MVSRTDRIVPSGHRCPSRAFSQIMLEIVVKTVRRALPPAMAAPPQGIGVCGGGGPPALVARITRLVAIL